MKYGIMNFKGGSSGGVTPEQAKAIAEAAIAEALVTEEKKGTANDVRTYDTAADFPYAIVVTVENVLHYYTDKDAPFVDNSNGTSPYLSKDTEYVAADTRTEYIWQEWTDKSEYSGEYMMVNQTMNKQEVEDIFNS